MKIVSCMKTINMTTLKKETPAKPVIAGKLMMKGQQFQGSYTKRTLILNQLLQKHIFFVDIHKVIMLPRMPGVKTAVFTKRLVTFCGTFAPLGKFSKTKGIMPTAVIWREGISGRNTENVASTFAKVIRSAQYQDIKHFIFWCDDCSGQNKN